jgi:hypothetical protein
MLPMKLLLPLLLLLSSVAVAQGVTTPTPHSIAVGAGALAVDVMPGDYNVAVGVNALGANTIADQSVAIGAYAAAANTTVGSVVAIGFEAAEFNTNGNGNTAVGYQALQQNVTGYSNTAIGTAALTGAPSSSSSSNTAVGTSVMANNTSGGYNVGVGAAALYYETSGGYNVALGFETLDQITTGHSNVGIGYLVGTTMLSSGVNNVLIGTSAAIDTAAADTSNTIQIGAGSTCIWCVTGTWHPTTAVETFHGTIALPEVKTGTNADFVCMSSGNVLTLQTSACTISSKRFKDNIADFKGDALAHISALEVASFNMKAADKPNRDPNYGARQIGLIAENIAQVFPECAIYEDDMRTPKSYRQECIIAMLVKGEQELMSQNAMLKARLTRIERPHTLQARLH